MKLKTLKSPLLTIPQKIPVSIERTRGRKLQRNNERIHIRDKYTCQICKVTKSDQIDHIIPLCDGGSDEDDNKQALCEECHKMKTAEENRKRGKL